MSIFDDPTGSQATTQWIKDSILGTWNQATSAYNNVDNLVWNNPYGLTAQQVFDGLGTNAGTLVDASNALKTCINRATWPAAKQVTSSKPANCTVTVNGNGTVTLTYS